MPELSEKNAPLDHLRKTIRLLRGIESPARPKKAFTGVRTSKFRHLLGTPMHKSNNIENVRNLSISLPGDSDAFQVNQEFAVFPLSGPGGQIAVVPVSGNLVLREPNTEVCESLTHCKSEVRCLLYSLD